LSGAQFFVQSGPTVVTELDQPIIARTGMGWSSSVCWLVILITGAGSVLLILASVAFFI
jgi:hypothetical protein